MKIRSIIRLCFLTLVLVAFSCGVSMAASNLTEANGAPKWDQSNGETVQEFNKRYDAWQAQGERKQYEAEVATQFVDIYKEDAKKAAAAGDQKGADRALELAREQLNKANEIKKTAGQEQIVDDIAETLKGNGGNGAAASGKSVFDTITLKAVTTLKDLRYLAYIISGFGIIVFAYGAIFGKISWKHLGNIGIGLFLIAMMAPVIEYFTQSKPGDGSSLKFGEHLAVDFAAYTGDSADLSEKECIPSETNECTSPAPADIPNGPLSASGDIKLPGASIDLEKENNELQQIADKNIEAAAAAKEKKKLSWKEIVGKVKAAGEMVIALDNGVKGALNSVGKAKEQLGNIKSAAKGLGKGSIMDRISAGVNGVNAYNNLSEIATSGTYGAVNDIAAGANAVQDFATDNAGREQNRNARLYEKQETNAVASTAKGWLDKNKEKIQDQRNDAYDAKNDANTIGAVLGAGGIIDQRLGKF